MSSPGRFSKVQCKVRAAPDVPPTERERLMQPTRFTHLFTIVSTLGASVLLTGCPYRTTEVRMWVAQGQLATGSTQNVQVTPVPENPVVVNPVVVNTIVTQPVQTQVIQQGPPTVQVLNVDTQPTGTIQLQCPPPSRILAGRSTPLALAGQIDPSLDVHWFVERGPSGSAYRFAAEYQSADTNALTATGAQTMFVSPIVGRYSIRAQARDAQGRTGFCNTEVESLGHGLRVELRWNTQGTDVDLHMISSNAPRWVTNDDCYYANRQPDAAQMVEPQRRWLDVDDVDGEGPENIRVDSPLVDREYVVGVHYYSSHGQNNATNATITVYCGEQMAAQFQRNLMGNRGVDQNDFWTVAGVRFDMAGRCAVRPMGHLQTQGAARSQQ